MKCPHCAAENKDAAKFCGKCGKSLVTPSAKSKNSKPCPACRHACKPDAKFCTQCGHNFSLVTHTEKAAATTLAPTVSALDVLPCPHCGAAIKTGAKFCGQCGNDIVASNQETLSVSVAMDEIILPTMGTAVELSNPLPIVEAKPAQPLPETIVEISNKPTASAVEITAPPLEVKEATIETVADESPSPPPRKIPQATVAAGVVALVIALGIGTYFLMKEKPSSDANEASVAPAASAVVASAASAVAAASAPVAAPVVAVATSPAPTLPPAVTPAVMPASPTAAKSEPLPKPAAPVASPTKEPVVREINSSAKADAVPSQAQKKDNATPARHHSKHAKAQKTIDEQYDENVAAECKTGLMGVFCRKSVKEKLCDGKWDDNPPQGQAICKR